MSTNDDQLDRLFEDQDLVTFLRGHGKILLEIPFEEFQRYSQPLDDAIPPESGDPPPETPQPPNSGSTDPENDNPPKEKKSTTPQTLKKISPHAHIAKDGWVTEDSLGYEIYAEAIYTFLTNPKTEPPIALSIQAPWGGGKTSIMRMVQKKLDLEGQQRTTNKIKNPPLKSITVKKIRKYLNDYKKYSSIEEEVEGLEENENIKETIKTKKSFTFFNTNQNSSKNQYDKPEMLTVWFNAWKYQNAEEIWAGLAHVIISQITERLGEEKREKFLLQLHLQREGLDKINHKIDYHVFKSWKSKVRKWLWTYSSAAAVSIVTTFLGTLQKTVEDETGAEVLESMFPGLEGLGISGLITTAIGGGSLVAIQRLKANEDVENQPSKNILGEFVGVPDYRAKLGFIHHADMDLQRVFKILELSKLKLVIFIDDLDRCSPRNVAVVVEAINMFLSAEYKNCFLVIGMASELVAAAMEESYDKVIQKLPKYSKQPPVGWRFMDKFVQLPISIPPPDLDNYQIYVDSLLVQSEKKKQNRESIDTIKNSIQSKKELIDIQDLSELETMLDQYENTHEVSKGDLKEAKRELQSLRFQQQSKNTRLAMKKASEEFTDENPEIVELITKSAKIFYENPREMKRFLNVLRYHYFVRAGRIDRGLSVPELDQLQTWIIFKMKWPQVAMWIQKGNGKNKLHELEKNSKQSFEDWKDNLRKLTQIEKESKEGTELEIVSGLEDESLKKFFKDNVKGKGKLSTAVGTGLF